MKRSTILNRTHHRLAPTTLILTTFIAAIMMLNNTVPATIQQNAQSKTTKNVSINTPNPRYMSATMPLRHDVKVKEITDPSTGRRDELFTQRPYTPTESWNFYTSDSNVGYLCQEDFWGLTDTFCIISWYGLPLIYSNGWLQGDPTGMQFEIKFYEDSGGYPGDVVATFSDLEPFPINTGQVYSDWEMYYWELWLPTGISLVDGWVSIQSTYCPDGSWLLWAGSPEGNFNAMQNNYSLGDNLAFNLAGILVPYDDVKIDSILQPASGPAAVIAPIINVTNIGCFQETFPLTVQITSSALEYNQTQIVSLEPFSPNQSMKVIFPDWTPAAWHNTIENTTIEYTISATAFLATDHNQSDNTKTQSFNLTYSCDLHRLFLLGLISKRTEDNTSISFHAKHLFYYDDNTSDYNRLSSGEKIIISKEHQTGYVGRRIIIGIFDGIVFSSP